jgi:C-terminal processing protease CtpA/Prc
MVQPGSVAEAAGVKVGDQLLGLGNIEIMDPSFGEAFRSRFGKSEGDSLPIKVRRGADTLTLHGTVKLSERVESKLDVDPQAGDKAARVRSGIFRGATDGQPRP